MVLRRIFIYCYLIDNPFIFEENQEMKFLINVGGLWIHLVVNNEKWKAFTFTIQHAVCYAHQEISKLILNYKTFSHPKVLEFSRFQSIYNCGKSSDCRGKWDNIIDYVWGVSVYGMFLWMTFVCTKYIPLSSMLIIVR